MSEEDSIERKKIEEIVGKLAIQPQDLSHFELQEIIFNDSFSKIYKVVDKQTNLCYCARILIIDYGNISDSAYFDLFNQLSIIQEIKFPSIVNFICYSLKDFKNKDRLTIIEDFCPNNTLDYLLENIEKGVSNLQLTDTQKLILIYGVASAFSYLHSLDIIHRDLKPANIFLDENLFPKVGDFALAIKQSNLEFENSVIKGTPVYMAPEAMQYDYTKKVDVYAFSMVVYQIMTGKSRLYDNSFNYFRLIMDVQKGVRPVFDKEIPKCYTKLIEDCWSGDPDQRPNFDSIVSLLENDKNFITENVNEIEFRRYVDYIKQHGH
ncbi:hypothetical protein M9Y10_018966 [Tritrichomonas musculus]|uniref:Protein kinase domain-containing protein n=1 Tax=Tritrichomonas musculus TaxID=1915356 RepID=A0ABR2HJ57_9EUKA